MTATAETAIDQYRAMKESMESIINRHMAEAFSEIEREHGIAPTSVSLNIATSQTMGEKYPRGIYGGCSVEVGGE